MFTEADLYVPSYNPPPPEIHPERCIRPSVQEPESWVTGSASPTVTPYPRRSSRYREIRPRLAPTSPPSKAKNEAEHKRTVKTPVISSHDAATQGPRSHSRNYPSYNGESAPHVPVEALQKALKAQVLQSLWVLRKIIMDHDVFNLKFETIEGWMEEIEGVDATAIPIASSVAAQVLAPFKRLDSILTQCITASGPMRSFIIREQTLELLK
ncbi:unnamed protein product, partial [Penicillium nalgiovense]